MATAPKTARVVSLEMTWFHRDLELPAGVVVEIPAERLVCFTNPLKLHKPSDLTHI